MNLYDTLTTLASCLCAQIVADGSPSPCFCGVIPGDAPTEVYGDDGCDECGMAWVRLVSAYPASGVGVQNTVVGNCSSELGIEVEVGIIRCVKWGDADGEPPTPGELLEQTEQQYKDLVSVWRAIACCPALDPKSWIVGNYTPLGPESGTLGGTFTVTMVA